MSVLRVMVQYDVYCHPPVLGLCYKDPRHDWTHILYCDADGRGRAGITAVRDVIQLAAHGVLQYAMVHRVERVRGAHTRLDSDRRHMRAAVVHVVLTGRRRCSGRAHTDAREEDDVKQEQRVVRTREQSENAGLWRWTEVGSRHGGSGVTVMECDTIA